MENKNKLRAILTPLIIALTFALGMLTMYLLPGQNQKQTKVFQTNWSPSSKLNNVLQMIADNYVDSISVEKLVEETIPAMLKNLDPHSVYIPAERFKRVNESLEGNFEGIGVQFNIQDDTILVVNTISGGPSERVGILPGDRIVTIDDSTFAGIGISNQDVIKNLKGEKGTKVTVGVKRRGYPKLIEFEITRDEIPLYSVDVSYMITDQIGYIKISSFSSTTYTEFAEAIKKLKAKDMKKLVVDLRSNGGGFLDIATDIIDEFLGADKTIVYTQGYARPRRYYKSRPGGMCQDMEVAVLIDAWSASASEIFAGAIQDNDRGIIIGQRSFGKGLVQEPSRFPDGSGIRLTIARYYTPAGRCIQKPYKNSDDYEMDIAHRMIHGEFQEQDSIEYNDSLKYSTEGGRTVYGGGGIIPDIFVPRDTTDISDYFIEVTNRGLIYSFSLDYTDFRRKTLAQFKTPAQIKNYLLDKNILQEFVRYAQGKGVEADSEGIALSEKIIKTRLTAYIARHILDNEGFYPIISEIDDELQKAVEVLKKNENLKTSLLQK